ncbi:carbonic anhydrase 2-like [Leptopilina heterotoma]|uniref:carbonic anhydrase 2-like n=1 Tax=Leptopilina heterotoma TaxID=63436 RepID=UPI001CA931DE|nr:carbonic anhydrase 2-like [Leptopilina heterotoma]
MTKIFLRNIFYVITVISQLFEIQSFDYQHKNEWYKQYPDCAGKTQSPLDINTSQIKTEIKNPIRFKGHDRQPREMYLKNNGHTVVINPVYSSEEPSVEGGSLNGTYILDSIHFHWGCRNNRGSEHTVNGKHLTLEMHMVHYNDNYCSIQDAQDKPNGLAVIGIFFKICNKNDGSTLRPLVENLKKVQKINEQSSIKPFSLKIFNLKEEIKLITYQGSLTTPPCYQTVTWILAAKIRRITNEQVEEFRKINLKHGNMENFRSVQPINNRIISIAKGSMCSI